MTLADFSTEELEAQYTKHAQIIGLAKINYADDDNNAAQWCFIQQLEVELEKIVVELDKRVAPCTGNL